MDCRTGNIVMSDEIDAMERSHFIPLNEEDVPKLRQMSKERRKNWMRNKPCICGSGKKFKKCCWNSIQ